MAQRLQALNTNVFSSSVQSTSDNPRHNPGGPNTLQQILFVPSERETLVVTRENPALLIVQVSVFFLQESPGNLVEKTKEYFRHQRERLGSNSVIFPVSPPELAWHLIHAFLQQRELMGGYPLQGGTTLPPAEEGVASVPSSQRPNLAAAWIYMMMTAIGEPDALLGAIADKPLPKTPGESNILSRLRIKKNKPSSPPASHSPGPGVATSHVPPATSPVKGGFGALSHFKKPPKLSSPSQTTLVESHSGTKHPSKVPGTKQKRSVEDANIPQGRIAKGTTGRRPQRRRFATNCLD